MKFNDIQPSQLYISKKKLTKIKKKFNLTDISTLEAIPIKKLGNEIFYTDGHTRAFAAYQAGFKEIPVVWEDEELDWEMYEICIKWCKDAGIYTIADLSDRIIDQKEYKFLWYKRCDELHKKLTSIRKSKSSKT
ncbi:MAG: ParB/Srx family N-terminal domain-containing protein [Candidatus Hermodarchaeota archaeon]